MLTVQQVASKLNITPQAVYHKMNISMQDELADFVKEVKKGNRTVKMIDEEGVDIIADSIEGFVPEEEVVSTKNDNQLLNILNETVLLLQEQLETKDQQMEDQLSTKDKQIDMKDVQIAELNERLREAQSLNQNNQVLLKQANNNWSYQLQSAKEEKEAATDVRALSENKTLWDKVKFWEK